MMETLKSITQNTPILALGLFGSLLGTIISYIAPVFTRDVLCADEDFRLGNLGLCVFVHDGIGHFIGNMVFFIPSMLWLEKYSSIHNSSFLLICFIGFAIFDGLQSLFRGTAGCGISGVAFMFVAIALTYAGSWILRVLLVVLFVAGRGYDADSARVDGFIHNVGFIVGAIIGTAYWFIVYRG